MEDSSHSLPSERQEVACPFCGIVCDDLTVKNNNNKLKIVANGCPKAKAGFEKPITEVSASIKGKQVSLDKAIAAAGDIIKQSSTPLFGGLATDAGGMRQLLHLADISGAVVDHMHGNALIRNTLVLQDLGWITTTMAEIRNRADMVVFVGTDATQYPRFFERVIWNEQSMFKLKQEDRQIVYIGENLNTRAGTSPAGKKPTVLKCKNQEINEIISTMHAITSGASMDVEQVGGIKIKVLEELAARIKSAKYGVFVWAPAELTMPHAELTVQAMTEMAKYLTRETRFAGFTLGGNDGATTANSICAWQSGYPLRVNFNKGYPDYDPNRYSSNNVLKNKEVDSLLWVSSFSDEHSPPKASIPTIVMATPETKLNFKPDVFIPVSTPGVDHAGQLFRTDSVVALPLKQLRESPHPSVASVIKQIIERM
ncbi:MAG: formylmethanofuran dehydrogenase subunit B [Gammaproteobacteria bacterium]